MNSEEKFNFKRRAEDKGLNMSGFRDISKNVITLLLAVIAFFLSGVNNKINKMEEATTEMAKTVAQTNIWVSIFGQRMDKLELKYDASEARLNKLEFDVEKNKEKLIKRQD